MLKRVALLLLVLVLGSCVYSAERDSTAYRRFIMQRCYYNVTAHVIRDTATVMRVKELPRYQIPKGNIFCRMEDYLTKRTGVWIKVGVWTPQK